MSPTVDVEMRRNRHGSVLAYADRDRAARLLEDHRGVLTSLYDLVDRRHGTDGEIVARLTIAEDRSVNEFDVRERFRRDLEPDRALAIVDDVRHHAGDGQLVTDGGEVSYEFEKCPTCGGDLQYQTRSDAECLNCGEVFCHEIRTDRHLLWNFDAFGWMHEVVARVE